MPRSITSIDAIFAITIPGVYNNPVILRGWGTDDFVDLDALPKVHTEFGLDGVQAAGYVKHPRKMKIKLSASSGDQQVFDDWAAAIDQKSDAIAASATITLKANGTKYKCVSGQLTNYKDMPDAKQTLQALTYEITWQSVTKAKA